MSEEFDTWWEAYCKASKLNREHLSFLDVDILREEMRLAFYHILPVEVEEDS